MLKINIPPTIIIARDHDNMFVYTKPATRCLSAKTAELTPKLILYYLKHYMDRGNDDDADDNSSRI